MTHVPSHEDLLDLLAAAGDLLYQLDEEKETPLVWRTRRRIADLDAAVRKARGLPSRAPNSPG